MLETGYDPCLWRWRQCEVGFVRWVMLWGGRGENPGTFSLKQHHLLFINHIRVFMWRCLTWYSQIYWPEHVCTEAGEYTYSLARSRLFTSEWHLSEYLTKQLCTNKIKRSGKNAPRWQMHFTCRVKGVSKAFGNI